MSRFATQTKPGSAVSDLFQEFPNPVRLPQNNNTWVRPSDWLALPQISSDEIIILVPIYSDNSNFFSFTCTTLSGAGGFGYRVDWGTGATDTPASGTTVSKQILWSDVSAGTLTSDGYRQAIIRIRGDAYDLSSFALALHPSVISVNADAQINEIHVISTTITSFTLGFNTAASNIAPIPRTMKQFRWSGTCNVTNCSYMFNLSSALQNVVFDAMAATNTTSMFNGCSSLQNVKIGDTASLVTATNMFSSCASLKSISLENTSALQTATNMFSNCFSLQSAYMPQTGAVTTAGGMFTSCRSLQSVYLPNLQNLVTATGMFSSCTALLQINLPTTTTLQTTTNMFSSCNSLINVNIPNMGAVITATAMFNSCTSLKNVTLGTPTLATTLDNMFSSCATLQSMSLSIPAATNVQSIFGSCSSLKSVTLTNTSLVSNWAQAFQSSGAIEYISITSLAAATTLNSTFNGCTSLKSIALPSNTLISVLNNAFSGCASLQTVTGINGNAATLSSNYNTLFNSTPSLQSIGATGMKFTHTIANCKMSATALNAYYTALPTVVGQTLTVTGNWGVAIDNPAIATAKGWTVTG